MTDKGGALKGLVEKLPFTILKVVEKCPWRFCQIG